MEGELVDSAIEEDFKIEQGQEAATRVIQFYSDFQNNAIRVDNYKRIFNELKNMTNTVWIQIENQHTQFLSHKDLYLNLSRTQEAKSALVDGMIPKEIFEAKSGMEKRAREIGGWLIILHKLNFLALSKIVDTLEEVNALQVSKDSLQEIKDFFKQRMDEIRQMDAERTKIFKDAIINTMSTNTNKFLGSLEVIEERGQTNIKEIVSLVAENFTETVKHINESTKNLHDLVSKSYPERFEVIQDARKSFDSASTDIRNKMQFINEINKIKRPTPIEEKPITKEAEVVEKKEEKESEVDSIFK